MTLVDEVCRLRGVGDQLSVRLKRIEDSQERLVELAVAEYINQNEASVRAAAVKQYSKATRHDQAYAERHPRYSCEGVSEEGDASLSNSDWVQKLILQEERLRDAVSTAKVREWLKNKLGGRGVTDMATAIVTAVEALCELGIVEKCNEDALGAGRTKGKRAFDFRKRPWHTIQASEQARAHVARLRVSADLFSD